MLLFSQPRGENATGVYQADEFLTIVPQLFWTIFPTYYLCLLQHHSHLERLRRVSCSFWEKVFGVGRLKRTATHSIAVAAGRKDAFLDDLNDSLASLGTINKLLHPTSHKS
jgi:hypothetical protein